MLTWVDIAFLDSYTGFRSLCLLLPLTVENFVAIVDLFAEIQGFKYVFVSGGRILITPTYRFFGSFVPRKTVSGQLIVPSGRCPARSMTLQRRICVERRKKTLQYVYFVKSTSPNTANTEDSNQVRDVRFSLARHGTFAFELLNITTKRMRLGAGDESRLGRR